MTANSPTPWPGARRAFTVLELTLALAILAVALVLVVQIAAWSVTANVRTAARRDALDYATNVLETARALPWSDLNQRWATSQRLPDNPGEVFRDARLVVRVEPEADRPRTKRVTVEVVWQTKDVPPIAPVRLTGLFTDRTAKATGGKP